MRDLLLATIHRLGRRDTLGFVEIAACRQELGLTENEIGRLIRELEGLGYLYLRLGTPRGVNGGAILERRAE